MPNEEVLGPRKTMFVLVIVVGCFAVLWPRILSPLILGPSREQLKPNKFDREAGCCEVLFDTDMAVLELINEVCSSAIQADGKLNPYAAAECRKAVNETCGLDLAAFLKRNENVGKTSKMLVETMKNSNSSCLREHFGVPVWSLSVHPAQNSWTLQDTIKQERPSVRGIGPHPALRERGRAIPPGTPAPATRSTVAMPPHVRVRSSPLSVYYELDIKPPPIPGMRPPLGSPGGPVPTPKSSMGFVMPIYTICIIVFFVYTISKIVFKRSGSSPYETITSDPQFRRRVFRDDSRTSPDKLVVTAISGLVAEVQQQMEASYAQNQQRQDVQDNHTRPYTNGTVLHNSGPVHIVASEYNEPSKDKLESQKEKELSRVPEESAVDFEQTSDVKESTPELEQISDGKESTPELEQTSNIKESTPDLEQTSDVKESTPELKQTPDDEESTPELEQTSVTKESTSENEETISEPEQTEKDKEPLLDLEQILEAKETTPESEHPTAVIESTPEPQQLTLESYESEDTHYKQSEFAPEKENPEETPKPAEEEGEVLEKEIEPKEESSEKAQREDPEVIEANQTDKLIKLAGDITVQKNGDIMHTEEFLKEEAQSSADNKQEKQSTPELLEEAIEDDDEQENASVKVVGMEVTAHAADGGAWRAPAHAPSAPYAPHAPHAPPAPAAPAPRAHEAEEVKSIFLETEIPQQSRVLVADFAENRADRPAPTKHSPMVVSGKMTLSLIQDAPRETPERDQESTMDDFTTASAVTQNAEKEDSDEEIEEEIEIEEIEEEVEEIEEEEDEEEEKEKEQKGKTE